MPFRGWVFMQTEIGRARAVLDGLKELPLEGATLLAADTITGPHDLVLYLEADSPDHLANTVQTITLNAEGVERTVTCHRIVLE